MWRWAGPVSAPPQLAELIQARIGALPPALRALGELVAFGEPLAFGVLARAGVSAAEVEAAERAGLLSTEEAGTDIRVRLGHPLFGEVIRSPDSAAAQAHRAHDAGRGGWLGRRAPVGGRGADRGLAPGGRNAARARTAGGRGRLGARRARLPACRTVLPGGRGSRSSWPAERLLAQALVGQGKAGPAEDLLAGQFALARTDAERTEIAGIRALNLYWGLNRPAAGRGRARPGGRPHCGVGPARRADAMRGRFLLHAGHCPQVAGRSRPVLDDPHVPHRVDAGGDGHGDHGAGGLRPVRRRHRHRGRGLQLGRPAAGEGWLLALDELASTQAIAYLWSGQLAAAAGWPKPATSGPWRSRSPPNVAVWALVRGQLAAARGAMIEASVWLREAIATARRPGPAAPLPGFHRPGRT